MAESLGYVKQAARKRRLAEQEWRATITRAVAEGHTLRQVARAAGVSHVRVLQISRDPGIRPAASHPTNAS